MRRLWNKIGYYDKIIFALLLGFIVFSVGYFVVDNSGIHCPICQKQFYPWETYLWDTRTGDIFSLSNYLNKESDVLWFDGKYFIPQEALPTIRCSYARFPYEVSGSPKYCRTHRSLFHPSEYFLILYAEPTRSMCYTIPDVEISISDGYSLKKQRNDNLNCWEIEIGW